MGLDLENIIGQVADMVGYLGLSSKYKKDALNTATACIDNLSLDTDIINKRIAQAKTTWLVPGVVENLKSKRFLKEYSDDYVIIAVDGSHIDIDRHHSIRCFLINIGGVQIEYGGNASATFFAYPYLYYRENEVMLLSEDGRKVLIEGPVLAVKRTIEELGCLTEKIISFEKDLPVVGLLDGTLTLWGIIGLENQDVIVNELINKGFISSLNRLKSHASGKKIAIASYISFPRSTELVNLIKILICPYEIVNCDYYCGRNKEAKPCDKVNGLTDRDVFMELLEVGERSAMFKSRSSIVENYYGEHSIYFFYLKLEDEVARVELPDWVAYDSKVVDLLHMVLLNQCKAGIGYPVALMEAHEKAVITGNDRNQFWDIVEHIMVRNDKEMLTSAKNRSKRFKWL